ncbi:MAG: MerC domain-containing protein [Tahibacter sp.]
MSAIADRFGATASFLCAVHCALLPFVIAILPALGLGFLADHGIERGFVLFACSLALTTIGLGYRRHRSRRALAFLLPGIFLLLAGVLVDFERWTSLHAWLVSCGGSLVAFAHFINLRLEHIHNEACRH